MSVFPARLHRYPGTGTKQKIKVPLSLQSSQSHCLNIKFFFPQEEGNFVHVYTGQAMTGLTWADNQPNNFDEQDCAMMEQNSSGIFDMSCSFLACPLCLLDISRPFQFSGLCQELQMDRKFLLLEVRGVGGCLLDDIYMYTMVSYIIFHCFKFSFSGKCISMN